MSHPLITLILGEPCYVATINWIEIGKCSFLNFSLVHLLVGYDLNSRFDPSIMAQICPVFSIRVGTKT